MTWLDHPFLQMALWGGLLASITSGIIGSYVVAKRISYMAGGISHSILGGIGIALFLQKTQNLLWLDPLLGALVAAILSALLLGWVHLRFKQREDALIGTIWTTGMACGVIFISLTPGSSADLIHYLFGNILWVTPRDLVALGLLDLIVIILVLFYYRSLLSLCFDEEQALLQGIPIQRLYLLLLCLVALAVVLLVQIIGTILALALLTIPATVASLFTNRLFTMMLVSIGLASASVISGLFLSYSLNWPPGATIALVSAALYTGSLLLKRKGSFS